MSFTVKNRVGLVVLILFFGLVVQGSFAMFRRRSSRRGILTKEGVYCPRRDKVFVSEADLGPRQYRNRSNDANFPCNWRRGRGMGGRGIPTKEGVYCPRCDKVFASEADLDPRQYRNRSNDANFPCNWGRGRGMGGRGRGRGRGRNF